MGTSRKTSRRAAALAGRRLSSLHINSTNLDRRRLRFESLEDRRLLAVLTVQNDLDDTLANLAGDSELSLREAIQIANNPGTTIDGFTSNDSADSIEFATALSGETIALTGGELVVTDTLTIDATGLAANVTIDAQQNSRVLHFTATTGDFTLNGLTVTGGLTTGDGGGIRFSSNGTLSLTSSTVTGNSSTGSSARGGGIFSFTGAVMLTSSTVSGNSTTGGGARGGGISTFSGAVTLTSSTVSGNSTTGDKAYSGDKADGGGISTISGAVTLTSSTVSGNSTTEFGADGGGISTSSGAVTLTSSTVSGNSTTGSGADGGGISTFRGAVMLTSSTVSGNEAAGAGGGVFVIGNSSNPSFTIENSIVAGNTDNNVAPNDLVPDPEGILTINHSLIGVADNLGTIIGNVGNQTGTAASPLDPLLGPLANNGGPTQTHALLPGSPALTAGPIGTAATLYDYRLDTFADSQSAGIDLTTLGGDGTLNSGIYEFGTNLGLQTQIPVTNADDYSIELYFKFDNIDGTTGYQQVLDFGTDTHPDAGLYVFNNRLRYFVVNPIGFYTSTNFSADTWYHLVLTRDISLAAPLRSYIDGQLQKNYPENYQGHTLGSLSAEGDSSATKVVPLFHSDTSFGRQQGGEVDRVRFYDRPLSSGEVSDLFDVGPNTIVPEFDQRGLSRQAGTAIDIGAYEAQITPSADFDTDGDVDGADFLRWQRGFGTANAMLADGNSDDDMDTDASDLAAWEVSYGDFTPPEEVASGQFTTGDEALIDAAIVMSLDNGITERNSSTDHLIVDSLAVIEAVSTSNDETNEVGPVAIAVAKLEPLAESADEAELDQSWLADELLERVFG